MTVELDVFSMSYGGEGIARLEGKVVFIPGALPEEKIKAEITEDRGNLYRARLTEVVTASKHRCRPACKYYDQCGGCQLQHINYDGGVYWKQKVVSDLLKVQFRLEFDDDIPIHKSPDKLNYRNRVRMNLKNGKLGFYNNDNSDIVQVENCPLLPDKLNYALALVRKLLIKHRMFLPGEEKWQYPEGIEIRINRTGTEILVILYSKNEKPSNWEDLVNDLIQDLPGFCGLIRYPAEIPKPGKKIKADIWNGRDYLNEVLHEHEIKVAASSFIQVNLPMAELMYAALRKSLKLTGQEIVVDAYAGVGAIMLVLAPYAVEMHGIESSHSAASDANANLHRHGYTHFQFYTRQTESIIFQLLSSANPDAIVLNPPRSGVHRMVLSALKKKTVPSLSYISCNPSTLGRDLKSLTDCGYKLKKIELFDMFPLTYHVETLVHLEKA